MSSDLDDFDEELFANPDLLASIAKVEQEHQAANRAKSEVPAESKPGPATTSDGNPVGDTSGTRFRVTRPAGFGRGRGKLP